MTYNILTRSSDLTSLSDTTIDCTMNLWYVVLVLGTRSGCSLTVIQYIKYMSDYSQITNFIEHCIGNYTVQECLIVYFKATP